MECRSKNGDGLQEGVNGEGKGLSPWLISAPWHISTILTFILVIVVMPLLASAGHCCLQSSGTPPSPNSSDTKFSLLSSSLSLTPAIMTLAESLTF